MLTPVMPSEEEWLEADMAAEALHGKPCACIPEDGIAAMQKRLADKPWRAKWEPRLLQEIRDTEARLAECRTQLQSRN